MEKVIRITEDRMLRIQVLDRCFSDRHRTYYIEDLLAECNKVLLENGKKTIQKRALWNDIYAMEGNSEWRVLLIDKPNNLENGRRFFRYADPNYSIFSNELNEEQVSQLKSMLLMLKQFNGLPQFNQLEQMIHGLETKYHFTLPESQHVISFDTNEFVEGLEYLSPIFSAIVGRRTIKLTYKPYDKEAYTLVAYPYYIKQYNNRWFLIGGVDGYDNLSNWAFDRIVDVQDCQVPYIPSNINFEEYFDDIIGVSIPKGDIDKVVLQVSANRFPYVQSKPLHPSQRVHKDDRTVELHVKNNKELMQKLLSYGSDLTVLEPQHLREQMKDELKKMVDNY